MALALPRRMLDRLAVGLSGLCLAHCLATTLLLAAVAAAGGLLAAPWVHEVGLALATLLAAVALGAGIRRHGLLLPGAIGVLGIGAMAGALMVPHGGGESLMTMAGVSLVALAHGLNSAGR